MGARRYPIHISLVQNTPPSLKVRSKGLSLHALLVVYEPMPLSPQCFHVISTPACLPAGGSSSDCELWNAGCASCCSSYPSLVSLASGRKNTHPYSLSLTHHSLSLHAPLFCVLTTPSETPQLSPATTLYLLSARLPGGLALGFSSPPPRVDLRPLAAAGQTNHHRLPQRL